MKRECKIEIYMFSKSYASSHAVLRNWAIRSITFISILNVGSMRVESGPFHRTSYRKLAWVAIWTNSIAIAVRLTKIVGFSWYGSNKSFLTQ